MKTKIGAILIGLMFLLSLIAAVPVEAKTFHKIVFLPDSDVADNIDVFDSTGKQLDSDACPYIYLEHGTNYKAIAYSGTNSVEVTFDVGDALATDIGGVYYQYVHYNIGATVTNNPPVAVFATPTVSGLTVNVNASGSTDADGDALTYNWNWGETGSAASTGVTASHTYAAAGAYTITLTVSDGKDTSTKTQTVTLTVASGDVIIHDFNFKDTVAPGAEVKFQLELENNATYDAEDLTATIKIEKIGSDEDDLETDIDFGTIDAGDKQSETVYITIPQDANDKTYNIVVHSKWYQDRGKDTEKIHDGKPASYKITIEKVKHQVSITSVQMDEAKYKAGDTVQIAVNLLDTGANDETVTLKATSDIGVTTTSASMKLKEGDATTQYLSFVVPEDAKAGKYFVIISANYGSYTASKTLVLEVASAEQATTVTVVKEPTGNATGLGVPATEIALAIVIILLIGAIAWMGKDLIRSPKAPQPRPVAVRSKVFK